MMPELLDFQSILIYFLFKSPDISVNDTLKFDFEKNKILDFVKLEAGNTVYITGGNN